MPKWKDGMRSRPTPRPHETTQSLQPVSSTSNLKHFVKFWSLFDFRLIKDACLTLHWWMERCCIRSKAANNEPWCVWFGVVMGFLVCSMCRCDGFLGVVDGLLVAFDALEDAKDKQPRAQVPTRPTHHPKSYTHYQYLPKEERGLQKPIHFSFCKKIVDGIEEYISRGRRWWEEGCPSPTVIFSIQKKVCYHHSDAARNDKHYGKHKQHKSVHVIKLVVPKRGENKVHFNKDWAER